jgi:hypothetical protein
METMKTMEVEKGQRRNQKRSTKGNTKEKIRSGGEQQKDNKNGKGEGTILERSRFKKKRKRILRLCETI